ncbi:MAG: relaxase domain-containing protein [Actinobacteria bacterium]|nr:relaxase domain-containing protein [Actinomycetota bacterium]
MLNIGKLARGQQDYYLNSVARGVEDYYVGSGEAPGYWLGGGSADIGLEGRVIERELTPILEGRHPETGEAMTRRHHKTRMPGFDLTFRAPKSVSLVHALGPKEASNEVVNAHDAAVAAALDYLERHTALGRRGTDGIFPIGSSGFVASAFRHRTSRAGDPLLHTHVLVANLIHGDDGKWSALDGRLLYSHAKTAGYLYQAQLRHELSLRLGLEWTPIRNGTADIEGVPQEVIKAFSKRRAEIEIRMEQRGEQSARAAQVATLDTRRAKDYRLRGDGLLPEWERRAKELGFSRRDLTNVLDREPRALTRSDKTRVMTELVEPEGLTRDASSFTQREVIQGLCERLPSGATVAKIEDIAEELLDSNLVVPLSPRQAQVLTSGTVLRLANGSVVPSVVDDVRYSTEELLNLEKRLIRKALGRVDHEAGVARTDAVRGALARRPSMSREQKRMVDDLACSGRGVEIVVGKAGTGKTFALDAARDAWESSGIRVIGCALSARAAKELEAGSGIESSTIAALMKDLDDFRSPGLERGSIIVVDEAGMVGTRQLDALLSHAQDVGAKVVLVGDDKQLPEIAAGGAFRALKEKLPAIELSEVRRQKHSWERDALELLREGRSSEAIEVYGERDRLVVGRDAAETRAQLVVDWWKASQQGSAVMIAARKADVTDLNEKARVILRTEGVLDRVEMTVGARSFSVGDQVMTLRNDRRLGVVNGSRGVVEALDEGAVELRVRLDDQRVVTLPKDYLEAGHVTHAYAITGHKAQGMTTDRALVLGDESMYREWGYVAMSRGREENRLYVVMGDGCGRDEVGGTVERPYVLDELTRALERSKAKSLASDLGEERDIARIDRATLQAERERIHDQLMQAPPDQTQSINAAKLERERFEGFLRRERNIREDAQERLASMTPLARARNRSEVKTREERIEDAGRAEKRLKETIRELRSQEQEVIQAQKKRERWVEERAPLIGRALQVENESARRDKALLRERESELPKYLENTVGPVPERPSERKDWCKAALAIEGYREKYGIEDRNKPFGRAPRNTDQRLDREQAERTVEEINDRRLDRSQDRDVGLERSLEIGV